MQRYGYYACYIYLRILLFTGWFYIIMDSWYPVSIIDIEFMFTSIKEKPLAIEDQAWNLWPFFSLFSCYIYACIYIYIYLKYIIRDTVLNLVFKFSAENDILILGCPKPYKFGHRHFHITMDPYIAYRNSSNVVLSSDHVIYKWFW